MPAADRKKLLIIPVKIKSLFPHSKYPGMLGNFKLRGMIFGLHMLAFCLPFGMYVASGFDKN